MTSPAFYRNRTNRRMAGAIALIALLMQGLAAYLPMPAMGGLSSWEAGWLVMCLKPGGSDRGHPADRAQDTHCAVCTVMQMAGSTATPADIAFTVSRAFTRIDRHAAPVVSFVSASTHAFSSRAPPFIA